VNRTSFHFLRPLFVFSIITGILSFQASTTAQDSSPTPEPSPTLMFTETPLPTATDLPTLTPVPTDAPTETPVPTETPAATATPEVSVTPSEEPSSTPTLDASLSPTATVTDDLTVTATSTESATPPVWTLVSSANFDAGPSMEWAVGDWILITTDNGQALQNGTEAEPLQFLMGTFQDVRLETRFLLANGTLEITLLENADARYRLVLHSDGLVELFRGDLLLHTSTIPLDTALWHSLRMDILGSSITLTVDEQPVFSVVDSLPPLPPGTVRFSATAETLVRLDDISLYGDLLPPLESTPTQAAESTVEASATPAEVVASGAPNCPIPNVIARINTINGTQPAYSGTNPEGLTDLMISANGRYTVFASDSNNLVANDTNNALDVFVFDRNTCDTIRVSLSSTGAQLAGPSGQPSISDDGRFVSFQTNEAAVSGDTNGFSDIYVYDRDADNDTIFDETGSGATSTERVSLNSSGAEGNADSTQARLSASGQYVVFYSRASNLVNDDTNTFCDYNQDGTANDNCADIFRHDRDTDTTIRISVASDSSQGNAGVDALLEYNPRPAISADGNLVVFRSYASNLVANDTNTFCEYDFVDEDPVSPGDNYDYNENCGDIFLRNVQAGSTTRVSVSSGGDEANNDSGTNTELGISADGTKIIYTSLASNLVPLDFNLRQDVFVYNTSTFSTRRISVTAEGWEIYSDSQWGSISADGLRMAFTVVEGDASIAPGAINVVSAIFVYRWDTTQVVLASRAALAATDNSYWGTLSADGSRIAFASDATNLVTPDTVAVCGEAGTLNCTDGFVAPVVFPETLQPPSGLFVANGDPGNFQIGWSDNSNNEGGFEVWRSADGRNWDFRGFVSASNGSSGSFQDVVEDLLCGTTYFYKVIAYTDTTAAGSSITALTTNACTPESCPTQYVNRLASTGSNGVPQGNNNSFTEGRVLSADGRYLVFSSQASNLVPNDNNFAPDVFRLDLQTCTVQMVSISSTVVQGNDASYAPAISADGQLIVFQSAASNLVEDDTNRYEDIFVHNMLTGGTSRVSIADGIRQGNGDSQQASISPDGRYVVFATYATNLSTLPDTNDFCELDFVDEDPSPGGFVFDYNENCADIYVFDRNNNLLELVSTNAAGTATANQRSDGPSVYTVNGVAYVLFHSNANNLGVTDNNNFCNLDADPALENCLDVYIKRMDNRTVSLLSRNTTTNQIGNALSAGPSFGLNGNQLVVVFFSLANNLTGGDTNGVLDIYISTSPATNPGANTVTLAAPRGNRASFNPHVSNDGRFVTFRSDATNLVPNDTNVNCDSNSVNCPDIFVHDRQTNTTRRVNVALSQANNYSYSGGISGDGRVIAYYTFASNLILGGGSDLNNYCFFGLNPAPRSNCLDVFVARNAATVLNSPAVITPTTGAYTVNLRWTDNNTFETGYRVIQRDNNNVWSTVADVPANTTTYTITGLTCSTEYTFSVIATNQTTGDVSAIDTILGVTTLACPLAPAPVLTQPANNATINDNTPELRWNAYANATGYQIQIATNTTFTANLQTVSASSNSFITAALNDGRYYWRVRTLNDAVPPVAGPFSPAFSFVVDTVPLSPLANLIAPTSNATIPAARPAFSWSAVAGATRYRLQVSADGFASTVLNQVVVPTSFIMPASLPPLTQGSYEWRVSTFDLAGNEGAFTAARSFTVFIGITPANGVFSPSGRPTFTWQPVVGATGYTLQIDTDTDFSTGATSYAINSGVVGTFTILTSSPALTTGTYYWRVVRNGETLSNTVFRSLFIGAAPPAPVLTAPANALLTNVNTPTLTWSAVVPPSGVILSGYELQFATNATFTTGLQSVSVPTNSYTPNPALTDRLYFWRVRALYSAQNVPGPFSLARSFTVDTTPLAALPALTAPVVNAIIPAARPAFSWSVVAGAARYRLQVSADGFTSTVLNQVVTTATYAIPATVLPLTQGGYQWRVSTIDPAGNEGAFTAPRSFTVFIGITPVNGAFSLSGRPTFTWQPVVGATGYTLQIDTDTDFSSGATSFSITPGTRNSFAIPTTSPALATGTYYWRVVRNGETLGNTIFRSLFIGAAPPAPVLTAPANALLTNVNTPTLTWNAVVPPSGVILSGYELQFATNATFTTGLQSISVPTNSYTPNPALTDRLYFWRVRALYSAQNVPGPFSLVRSFTVDTTPLAALPTLTIPAVNAITPAARPAFSWSVVAGAARYRLQVSADGFTSTVLNQVVTTASYAIPTTVPPLTQGGYQWRVSTIDPAGNEGAFTAPRSFTVFIGITPANGAFSLTGRPTFTWQPVFGSTGYTLQIDTDTDFSTGGTSFSITPGTRNSFAIPTTSPALATGTYYWRVIRNGETLGNTIFRTLFIGAAPAAPVLTAPANGSATTNNLPTFSWNAVTPASGIVVSGYEIQFAQNALFTVGLQTQTVGSTSYTPAAALADRVYYWRVRAIFSSSGGNVPGAWSIARVVTVDTTGPAAAPNLLSPANGVTTADTTPNFTWQAVAGAANYVLEVSTASDFSVITLARVVTGTSYTVPAVDALPGALYYWRVVGRDALGNRGPGNVRSFTLTP
jgi:hypothetical protein